jgi:hypothetical protein
VDGKSLPQLSFQFYELGLEFNHGVCDDAGLPVLRAAGAVSS